MSDEIPFHIQEEIMKRLPVVSLLQFRSVSKAWKSVIDNSNFIAAHSVNQPQHLFLKYDDPVETAKKYISFLDDDTFPEQRFVHILPQPVELLKRSSIIGSSLGLLCFHGYTRELEDTYPDLESEMVVLWNPSIKKTIVVSVPNNINPDSVTELDFGFSPDCAKEVGFGVCPLTGDPKIFQITQCINPSYNCEASIYTVSSGKWRNLSSNLPSKPFQVFWPQVVIDRFIYWCAFDTMTMDSNHNNHLMSFDTTDENLGVVDLPDSLRCHCPPRLCISKVKESLVMLEYDDILKRACVVWMMEINGVQKSFTKLYTVEVPYGSRTIATLGFRKSGKPIMEVENGHDYIIEQSELVGYDPNSERFDYLEIYGTTESFVVNSYMETLVLLGQSGCSGY